MRISARLRRFFPATSLVFCAFAATPACVPGDDAGGSMQVLRPLKVNPAVRLPEQDEGFSEVEVQEDSLIFFYSGAASAPLAPGDVIAGSKDGGYLRRVLTTEVLPDGRLQVATEHAYLTDYLTSGRFRIAVRRSISTAMKIHKHLTYSHASWWASPIASTASLKVMQWC